MYLTREIQWFNRHLPTPAKELPRVLPRIVVKCPNCGARHLGLFISTAQCRACHGIHLIDTEKVWGIHDRT